MFDSIFNQSAIGAAQAQQGAGADGRTVLNGNNLLSTINPMAAPKWMPPTPAQYTRDASGDMVLQPETPGYFVSSNGTRLESPDGGKTFTDTYDNPTGNGSKDKAVVTYEIRNGMAVPISADNQYQGSEWIRNGRDTAITLGSVLGAGALGAVAAGAGAAGTGTGVAGGSAATGNMALIDSGLGTAGYGGSSAGSIAFGDGLGSAAAGGAGGGVASAGGSGGTSFGNGAYDFSGATPTSGGSGATSFSPNGFDFSSTAGGATGGGSNPGFLSSLASGNWSGAASAAGDYLTSAGGLGTAAQLVSGYLGSNAASKAAQAQIDSANNANQLLSGIYQQTRQDNMPALAARNSGLAGYSNLLNNPSNVQNDPGYAFGRDQGVQSIDRSAAGKGGLYSGATLKAQTRFGTDYATTKYDNALSRYGNLAQLGSTGTQTIANSANSYGQSAASNITGAGNAAASGTVGSANAWGNALSGAYNGYMQNNLINSLIKNNGG